MSSQDSEVHYQYGSDRVTILSTGAPSPVSGRRTGNKRSTTEMRGVRVVWRMGVEKQRRADAERENGRCVCGGGPVKGLKELCE